VSLSLIHSRKKESFQSKTVWVLGLGVSGRAIARYLVREGARVHVSDSKTEVDQEGLKGVTFHLGDDLKELPVAVDALVLSPGIPQTHPLVQDARSKNTRVTSEAEIAFALMEEPVIAITGTSGKTTTTTLIGEMLKKSGFDVFVGGNIGRPLIEHVMSGVKADFVVAELSSYQLELIESLSPRVAVWTTIDQDHMDRYKSMENYIEAKKKLLKLCSKSATLVINRDNRLLKSFAREGNPVLWFTQFEGMLESGAFYEKALKQFTLVANDDVTVYSVEQMKMLGEHNIFNLMAAACACVTVGCKQEAVQSVIDTYPGLPHRIEMVRELGGIRYINDSKATNTVAVKQSLSQFEDGKVLWLAGGRDKGIVYSVIGDLVRQKCKSIYFFGESREKLATIFKPYSKKITVVETMAEALKAAQTEAKAGDVVLLSPACSSFDQFKSFEDRGDQFKAMVVKLK